MQEEGADGSQRRECHLETGPHGRLQVLRDRRTVFHIPAGSEESDMWTQRLPLMEDALQRSQGAKERARARAKRTQEVIRVVARLVERERSPGHGRLRMAGSCASSTTMVDSVTAHAAEYTHAVSRDAPSRIRQCTTSMLDRLGPQHRALRP